MWESIVQWVSNHQVISSGLAVLIVTNFVAALPSPNNSSNSFYKFFFAFVQGVLGGLPRVFPALRLPGDPTRGSQTYFAKPDPNQGQQP